MSGCTWPKWTLGLRTLALRKVFVKRIGGETCKTKDSDTQVYELGNKACICISVSSSERLRDNQCAGVFAHMFVCVGCIEGLIELGICRREVELQVLVCRGCYGPYRYLPSYR